MKTGGDSFGRVLVVSMLGDQTTLARQEALLAKALQIHGCEPFIVTTRPAWANRIFRTLGIDRFVFFESFFHSALNRISSQKIEAVMNGISSFSDLLEYEYDGVKVGKYICSTLLRRTRQGSIDPGDQEIRDLVGTYLVRTMANTMAAGEILDKLKPDTVMFLERGYTPYGEFFDLSLKRGLNVIQWLSSHRESALTLKRYNTANADKHPVSLSEDSWKRVRDMTWDKKKEKIVKDELFQDYTTGNWFSVVGTQFKTQLQGSEKIRNTLHLASHKKNAVVFSPLFWDATFFWGEDLFDDYREWFIETVKAACTNTALNWIIKLHPAGVVKDNQEGYHGKPLEIKTLEKEIGRLPDHVILLPADTAISTYSLYSLMDYCVTVRGTVGIEASVFGIPVFTAGTGRYDGLGFTFDSATREEYLEKLSRIHTYPPLDRKMTDMAQKYAYGLFLLRPFNLESIHVSYARDGYATIHTDYLINSAKELYQASDIKAFSDWVMHSEKEDYINMIHHESFSL